MILNNFSGIFGVFWRAYWTQPTEGQQMSFTALLRIRKMIESGLRTGRRCQSLCLALHNDLPQVRQLIRYVFVKQLNVICLR